MEDSAISDKEHEAIRRRLIVIRQYAACSNQAEFARRLQISPTRWNNIERGWLLTLKLAFLITKRVAGLPIQYITHGDDRQVEKKLKRQLYSLLAELERELSSSSKSKRGSANR
jgi:DNA-binding XRE family transcriptional regulator